MGSAQFGFIAVAIAFPLYLLWKGELPTYLKFMTANNQAGIAAGVPNFSVTPSTTGPLGPSVMGTPGSGSGAAGSPLPIPAL